MNSNVYIYILVAAIVTYALRLLPILLIKEQIQNKFIRSFLYYVPYVTLAVMTFPAIINSTVPKLAGLLAVLIGSILALKGHSLLRVAIACSLIVYIVEYVFRVL